MAENLVSSYCLNTEGFPRVLYTTLQKLGVKERPVYQGHEYVEHGTERCEVTVYIAKSEEFPEATGAWGMTATRFRFTDACQAVAHKALQHLCQIYEDPIARTPMRFFPPRDKNRLVWEARMESLQGQEAQEEDPIVAHLMAFFLALDEQHDRQALEMSKCLHRAEEAELFCRMLEVQLAEAHADTASAESREAAVSEALKKAQDSHAQELKNVYLVTRCTHQALAMERREPLILEGSLPVTLEARECPILDGSPIAGMQKIQAAAVEVPPAPPSTDALQIILEIESNDAEEISPLTQPFPPTHSW